MIQHQNVETQLKNESQKYLEKLNKQKAKKKSV